MRRTLFAWRGDLALGMTFGAIGFAPITALAAAIFEVCPLPLGALAGVGPAALVALALGIGAPVHGRRALTGFVSGLAAVLVYDAVRWLLVSLVGGWADFIPNIGGWLLGTGQPDWLLGYTFRWLGDGGGMGMAYAAGLGLLGRRAGDWRLGLAYGVGIWLCLLATLLLAPRGQAMLFPSTPMTFTLSLIGHLVYGATLGALCGWAMALRPAPARPGLVALAGAAAR